MSIPLSSWINRFLVDLAFYLGRSEEAHSLLKDTKIHNLEKNLRLMSLSVTHTTFNVSIFFYYIISNMFISFFSRFKSLII